MATNISTYIKRLLILVILSVCSFPLHADNISEVATKYREWISAPAADYSDPLVMARYKETLKNAKYAERNIERYDEAKATSFDPATKIWIGDFNTMISTIMSLSVAYHIPGCEQRPNPYYHNAETLKGIILTFERLEARGWEAGFDLRVKISEYEKTGNLSLGGNIALSYLGYGVSVFLMQDELKAAGELDKRAEMLNWITQFIGTKYNNATMWATEGLNTDTLRSLMNTKLCQILTMPADHPDREAEMVYFKRLLDKALMITPGFNDTIKPDYVGYHHRAIYANAYAVNSYHAAAIYAHMLEGTPYQISDESLENLSRALLTNRIYAQKYDIPRTVSGRMPYNLNTLQGNLPAFAILASMERNPHKEELRAAFARLWNPQDESFHTDFVNKAGGRISYLDSMGSICETSEFAKQGFEAESDPNGYWFFPYAGMTIYRQGDWMVSHRGTSKYIWNSESPINKQNEYGRYNGAGVLQIYATGNPISAEASGYGIEGWRWSRLPGTTTLDTPAAELPNKQHRLFTPTTYLGGVELNGECGVSAFSYIDSYSSLTAEKSLFFFGDYIYAMGSGITSSDEKHPVQTTIAQLAISSDKGKANISGKRYVDPYGHAYLFVDAKQVVAERAEQEEPMETFKKRGMGKGYYETCRIIHGENPTNASYSYVIEVNGGEAGAQRMEREYKKLFDVLRADNTAHIVSYLPKSTTGYAIRKGGVELNDKWVKAVDTPCVMAIESGKGAECVIAVSNPDMNRYDEFAQFNKLDYKILTAPSRRAPVAVTLNGEWQLAEANEDVTITSSSKGQTTLLFNCIEAATIKAKIVKK